MSAGTTLVMALLAQWPAYPDATVARVDLADAGSRIAPAEAAYFVTSDGLDAVAAFFAARWRAEGLPILFDGEFLEEGVVAAYDVHAARQHAAVMVRLPDARTLVFLTVTPFEALHRAARPGAAEGPERLSIEPSSRPTRIEVAEVLSAGHRVRVRVETGVQSIAWERVLPDQEGGP